MRCLLIYHVITRAALPACRILLIVSSRRHHLSASGLALHRILIPDSIGHSCQVAFLRQPFFPLFDETYPWHFGSRCYRAWANTWTTTTRAPSVHIFLAGSKPFSEDDTLAI